MIILLSDPLYHFHGLFDALCVQILFSVCVTKQTQTKCSHSSHDIASYLNVAQRHWTALMHASFIDNAEAVQVLLSGGANMDQQDKVRCNKQLR